MVSKRREIYIKIGLFILKPALVFVLLLSCLYVYAQDIKSLPSNIILVEGDTYRLDTFKENMSFMLGTRELSIAIKTVLLLQIKRGRHY